MDSQKPAAATPATSASAKPGAPVPTIGLMGFFMMTASMVMTVYSYPAFATSGLSLIFFLLFAGVLFFIPTALVSAELATGEGWQVGGIYTWCSQAFGRRWGFTAVFLQWLQITVGFVTMLYFVTGALSYLFDWSALNTSPWTKLIGVLIVFWLITIANFAGTKWTARLAMIGLLGGVVVPAILLVVLGVLYVVQGHEMAISFTKDSFFPDFTKVGTLVILVAFILSYAGVESSAPHVNELRNPRRNYPLAIIMLVVMAIVINILGALSIAIVIPAAEINLSAGVLQTFKHLLDLYHLGWLLKVVAVLLAIGTVAEVSAWVVGPSKAMVSAAKDGLIPRVFGKENSHGVPVPFVLFQGIIVTIWAFVLTLGGGGNNLSFLLAMALTVVTYLTMYILLFFSYLRLKTKHADVPRAYSIPGGKAGGFIVAIIGLLMAVLSIVISFFPPSGIGKEEGAYETILIISWIIIVIIPHVIYAFRDKSADGKPSTISMLQRISRIHPIHALHPRGRHPFESADKDS